MVVKHLHEDGQLAQEFQSAGDKLVMADFFATWCQPCRTVAPEIEKLSVKYGNVVFVKIDVDEMSMTAQEYGIRAMPTFLFFKNGQKVAEIKGGNLPQIEANIQQYAGATAGGAESGKDGMFDLTSAVDKGRSECLNGADDSELESLFKDEGYLESDCDEQLIINVAFNQPVKLHSIKFKGPKEAGPKTVKLWVNLPMTIDFDQALATEAVQELSLTPSDLTGEEPVLLKYVKFQNVQNVQLFIKDNQIDSDTTRLDQLCFFGVPLNATNMGDFKRVAGKKGESE